MSLIVELRRRNVFRVAAAYVVVGWLLTEVLTTILPELGAPDWISRTVKLVFAFGFIPAVVLSWIYEITPEGIKREHEVVRDESITPRTAKKLDYVTIGAVIAGIVFVAAFSAKQSGDVAAPVTVVSTASVAVLPFVNMSNDRDNEYFSDGLTETLLHMLAQVPGLKVAARTSSFAFKDQDKTIGEIASALGVAHVLEGSVQRVGDRVRITAQLIRADDGFHVWSENYDRTLDDIFGIQDEIAGKVGGALSVSLLGAPANTEFAGIGTEDPDAYDLYLQAISERDKYSYGGLKAAEGLLKGALTVDSEFLDAKTELAVNYLHQIETGLMDGDVGFPLVKATAEQVIAADPDNALARGIEVFTDAARTTQAVGNPGELFAAIDELRTLTDANPGQLQLRIFLMRLYQGTQQMDLALPLMQAARVLDPFNARIYYELGTIYTAMERWDEARAALEKSLEIEPSQPNAIANLAGIHIQTGEGLQYLQRFIKAIEVDPVDHELPGLVANFLYQLELVDEADDFRKRVLAIAPTSEIAYRLEVLRAMALGDEEASVASARRAIEDDVEDRRFAYGGAAQHLLRVAASKGTVEEELAYLEEQAPGILDLEAEAVPLKYRSVQLAAFDAWYKVLPQEELNRRIDYVYRIATTFGIDPDENPYTEFGALALRGEPERAKDVALERIFTQPVTRNLGWEETFKQAQYAEVVADPRVQDAMRKWQHDEDELREKVRTWLADLHAAG
jgi:TolB-like protein/tetratricopeptide (TPR) repeat protein